MATTTSNSKRTTLSQKPKPSWGAYYRPAPETISKLEERNRKIISNVIKRIEKIQDYVFDNYDIHDPSGSRMVLALSKAKSAVYEVLHAAYAYSYSKNQHKFKRVAFDKETRNKKEEQDKPTHASLEERIDKYAKAYKILHLLSLYAQKELWFDESLHQRIEDLASLVKFDVQRMKNQIKIL